MFRLLHNWNRTCATGPVLGLIPAVLITIVALTWTVLAQETQQRAFASPQEAMQALVGALQAAEKQSLTAILGPDSEEILSSGDPVADKADRQRFLNAYDERVSLVPQGDDQIEAILGNDSWPFPIPLVRGQQGWFFDTTTGKEELLNRRIGRNELDTIAVCQAYVEAQEEYAGADRDQDGVIEYAQKVISDPDQRNGLSWEVEKGEVPSPLGPFMAQATAEGYRAGEKPIPFHGYYYRILKAQGPAAPGGAYDYVINGDMVAGYALVAWPADYGVSGIMTFVVNRNGIVHEKDLGPETGKMTEAMTQYNPDETWKRSQ